jgi:RNA polymerase sigma-70 factor (ECF subfamily)
LLERKWLKRIAPEGGRFRSYLLTSCKHFLADERAKAGAQKRGGGATLLSIDAQTAEHRYQFEPVDALDPERLFERRWALTLLETALVRLEAEFQAVGKQNWFEHLRGVLLADPEAPAYAEIGQRLGVAEGTIKVAVHRARKSFRRGG